MTNAVVEYTYETVVVEGNNIVDDDAIPNTAINVGILDLFTYVVSSYVSNDFVLTTAIF